MSTARRDLRTAAAVALGRLTATASRVTGRGSGSIIGGRVLLAVQPRALGTLVSGRPVTLVSGTNGKTTTTRLLADALRTRSSVATNASGANIAAALAATAATPAEQLVLEVDELYLPQVLQQTGADLVVLLSLSRDQLDRMNETQRVATLWRKALQDAVPPPRVVANADDPLVAWVAEGASDVVWVGTGSSWGQDSATCSHCGRLLHQEPGSWWCECGRKRQPTRYAVAGSRLETPGGLLPLALQLPGAVNAGNAALATAAAAARGVAPADSLAVMAQVTSVGNRYRSYPVGDRKVRLLLAKNPAGWAELLPMLDRSRLLVVAINARAADGRDPSWLWDVPFEQLAGATVLAIGDRRLDLAVRLSVAGVDVVVADGLRAGLAQHPQPAEVDAAANYTAFRDLASELERAN
jgi:lipid II isoglutaminyl synthase (glutamine-hydrolysing)